MTCAHCHTTVIPTSCGYVHADTHNTQGADGHRATPAPVSPERFLPTGVTA